MRCVSIYCCVVDSDLIVWYSARIETTQGFKFKISFIKQSTLKEPPQVS